MKIIPQLSFQVWASTYSVPSILYFTGSYQVLLSKGCSWHNMPLTTLSCQSRWDEWPVFPLCSQCCSWDPGKKKCLFIPRAEERWLNHLEQCNCWGPGFDSQYIQGITHCVVAEQGRQYSQSSILDSCWSHYRFNYNLISLNNPMENTQLLF